MTVPTALSKITPEEFAAISEVLREQTGIRLVPGKEALVMGRLTKRLRQLGIDSYGDYVRQLRLRDNGDELREAVDLLTTNETSFFRERRHFDFICETVLPQHVAQRPFRLWSAASSTGEEAYTAAMVLAEGLRSGGWEVIGTDISSRVVASAQRGLYPIEAARRIPRAFLLKYGRKGKCEYEGLMTFTGELRQRVRFEHANLMGDLRRLGKFDVIMLRNVMIYFDGETRRQLIDRLQTMLCPGGYLMIGHSETIAGSTSRLRLVQPSIYQLHGDQGV